MPADYEKTAPYATPNSADDVSPENGSLLSLPAVAFPPPAPPQPPAPPPPPEEPPAYIEPWEISSIRGGCIGVRFPCSRLQLLEGVRGRVVEYQPGQMLDMAELVGMSQAPHYYSVDQVIALARQSAGPVIALKVHQGRR